ncbi:Ornithine cyclodeaminase [Fulvivirga imtechensis AK7]|uniref:Ornithine cyclodeaminase n=1 Tax=Fulvivirga imtechensis AK7 TaxID=1237149 RepID=L8JU37_9BACT|nr:ornithine cyclodeaminase [Fulvivirga imtechensis]ELR72280.1 Ornithine cyclodeaminase [Fulvivirga imtechensis AK7]
MIYISDKDIKQMDLNWSENINIIEESVKCMKEDEYSQPVKPYLRYRNLKNRIIAMPAFIGGNINRSGIKWISSFPDNINNGKPRAHCVVILNDADTGEPVGILNSSAISSIRTASVSGFVLKQYLSRRRRDNITLGIVGFGPIGQYHLSMCAHILAETCNKVLLHDIKGVDVDKIPREIKDKVEIVDSWEKAYNSSDVFITCTVSSDRYINKQPKPGSLHLNVSLRDYKAETFHWFKEAMTVDDWDEVCRENTDIQQFYLEQGLRQEGVRSILDWLDVDWISSLSESQAIMFNPMGMAIFDIAMSQHYCIKAQHNNSCLILD